jgi:serine/threonine protein phosphatase PrpC
MFPSVTNSKEVKRNGNRANSKTPLLWNSAAKSHVGMVRKVNEDAVFTNEDIGLWVVADGMGGHEAGDVASQMIIHALENNFSLENSKQRLSEFVEYLDDEMQAVNRRIQQHSDMIMQGKTLGSTVVALAIRGQIGFCVWAGDSRLYKYHDGRLVKITTDHSKVEELVELGMLLPEEAENHPESNVITRAVGAYTELFLDHYVFHLDADDTYLLCSDGLYNSVDDDAMSEQLQCKDVERCAQGLIDLALANDANDNVSVIVVRCSGR